MTKTMPWEITDTYGSERKNTGHDHRWDCTVRRDCGGGTALTPEGAEFLAARHSATHTETELASTGYVVRVNYAALAASRL